MMTDATQTRKCLDCGHEVRRPMQERCPECGLQWADWFDGASDRLRMRVRDWLLIFVAFPVLAAIPPLLVGRGAIMGARTFEASYYLTIPAFAGMFVLAWFYAGPIVWWWGRRGRVRRDGVARRPAVLSCILAFLLLLVGQVILYLIVIRVGFILLVEPLRAVPRQTAPFTIDAGEPTSSDE